VKVLHVIDSGGLYGAEVMLLNLMKEQSSMGLQPLLASIGEPGIAEKPIEAEARKRGLAVESFRMRPGPNFKGAMDVLRYARREQVDLLHSHGYKGNILFGLVPRRIRRLPIVATVHGWTWTGGANRMGLYEWLDGACLRFLDRVVLVNKAMLEHPRLKGRSNLRCEVVNNGIAAKNGSSKGSVLYRDIEAFCRSRCTIGAIGRLSREKGFELLIEAMPELLAGGLDIQLLLLGEGGERARLTARIDQLGLGDRVLMPGYIEAAGECLSSVDVFVLPSLTEGLPIVLLEAMQSGVPIVASRVGGIPQVLREGRAGLLVEPGQVASLVQGITEAIRDHEAAALRSQLASELVASEYSCKAMTARYRDIYSSVLVH